jgi:hypothetical protein
MASRMREAPESLIQDVENEASDFTHQEEAYESKLDMEADSVDEEMSVN